MKQCFDDMNYRDALQVLKAP
eukprot:SAG11_NODE_38514_length_252_cov_0.660131_1_plen_20_part_01